MTARPAALIVEDQPFVGLVASDILRESGFDTFHAYDARDAAAMLDEHPEIEVLLTEADLPGDVTGYDLCRQVSREHPRVQLVVTAADGSRSVDMPAGAHLLRKPYASGDLKTLIGSNSLQEA